MTDDEKKPLSWSTGLPERYLGSGLAAVVSFAAVTSAVLAFSGGLRPFVEWAPPVLLPLLVFLPFLEDPRTLFIITILLTLPVVTLIVMSRARLFIAASCMIGTEASFAFFDAVRVTSVLQGTTWFNFEGARTPHWSVQLALLVLAGFFYYLDHRRRLNS
jgi:hypothetical protein